MDLLKNYLDKTWDAIMGTNRDKVLSTNDPIIVKERLDNTLPIEPQDYDRLLEDFTYQIRPFLNLNESPQFGAYITGSGNKISAFAEFIKAWYNQNGLKWNNSPIASELEQLVIRWVAEFVKLPYHKQGFITSGGSMSNLMALHMALADKFPEREMEGLGSKIFTVYCSTQTHSSIDRAMVFLGLGRDQLRKIDVNEQFEVDPNKMKRAIEADIAKGLVPLSIIGNAGTTNTGSIDDLNALALLAKEFGVWYHVDGAYGLPAIRLPELEQKFAGIKYADSVVINPHKWMYVTFEASCLLFREIPQAIHFSPDYLFTQNPGERWESSTHTIELSKEFRALKIWFTMKYFGSDQLTAFVRKDIRQIDYLAELIRSELIVVEVHHPLSILCFRYENPNLNADKNEQRNIEAVRHFESDGKIFITGTKLNEKTYLRVYFGNPNRTDVDVEFMANVIKSAFH